MVVDAPMPWEFLRDSGLLWLINATTFHPRGYALAIHNDDEGNAVGWSLMGDGTSPWQFDPKPPTDEQRAAGAKSVDELFAKVKALLA